MNPNINRIFLHIGVPKSGTTSLQKSLSKNQKSLNTIDGGYLYPKVSHIHHGRFIYYKFGENVTHYFDFIRKYRNRVEFLKFLKNETKFFEQQIENTMCKNLIISGEQIPRLSEKELHNLKNYLSDLSPNSEICVVICTREHTSRLSSSIQQRSKTGENIIIDYIIKSFANYYKLSLYKFLKVFNKENFIVYKFEDAIKHENGPIGMFLEQINASVRNLQLINVKSNEGINNKAVEMMLYINSRLPIFTNGKLTRGRLWYDTKSFGYFSGSKFLASKEAIMNLHEKSLSDKIWLKDNFGIDYINSYSKKHAEELNFDDRFFKEFKLIYPTLSLVIKKLCYDYFYENFTEDELNENNKLTLKELLNWMDKINDNFKSQDLVYFINSPDKHLLNLFPNKVFIQINSTILYYRKYGLKKSITKAANRIRVCKNYK